MIFPLKTGCYFNPLSWHITFLPTVGGIDPSVGGAVDTGRIAGGAVGGVIGGLLVAVIIIVIVIKVGSFQLVEN